MKLLTRYSAAGLALIAIAAIVGGLAWINSDFDSRISTQTQKLNLFAKKVIASTDPLSAALMAADDFGSPLSVVFISSDGAVTNMVQGEVVLTKPLSTSMKTKSESTVQFIDARESYLLRSVDLQNGDYLAVMEDVSHLVSDRNQNAYRLGIASLLVLVFGGGLIAALMRLDTRRVIRTLETGAAHERETRQAMQTFMGDASHELRTPLTVIKGYAELLAGGQKIDKDAKQKAYQRIVEQVDRMDETIGSLLKLAEAGSVSANSFEAVSLTDLVENAVDDLEAIDQKRPVRREVAPAIEIAASRELITSLLNNAIGNIHRHTPATAPVRIALSKSAKMATLVVEDGGPGLPEAAYEKGIRAFQRFDASRSRTSGGTGLGMAIMNSIVESHRGTLGLSKSPLGGLRIEIALPLK